MRTSLSRRTWLGRLTAALAGWAGLRPAASARAAAACLHPVHLPLCADRPGSGRWFGTRLRLACPLCGETARHHGYLPDPVYAYSQAVIPPGPVEQGTGGGLQTYTDDAAWPGAPVGASSAR